MERVAILFSLIVLASARSSGDEKRAAKPKKSTDEITKDRIIIVRPELYSVIVTPRAVSLEGNIKWQDAQMCKGGSFASGFLQWQDDSGWDQKGLTKLQFVCTIPKLAGLNHTLHRVGEDRQRISVGIQYGKQTGGTEFCPIEGMFFVGMKVVFGGWHLGVIEVRPICDSINWWSTSGGGSGAPKPPARELSRSLAAFGWNKVGSSKGWEKSEPYYCPKGMAICGINSSNDQSMGGFLQDGSGINLIEFFCCPFPILMNGEKMESA